MALFNLFGDDEDAGAPAATTPDPGAYGGFSQGAGWRENLGRALLLTSGMLGGQGGSGGASLQLLRDFDKRRYQALEAGEIQRIYGALSGALESSKGDYTAALNDYRQRLGANPFRSTGAAQLAFRVIPQLSQKAIEQQRGKENIATIARVVGGLGPGMAGADLYAALVNQGVDEKTAAAAAELQQKRFTTNFDNGLGQIVEQTGGGVRVTPFGTRVTAGSEGVPIQAITQGPQGITAEPVLGSMGSMPQRGRESFQVQPGQESGTVQFAPVLSGRPPLPSILETEWGKLTEGPILRRFGLNSPDDLDKLDAQRRRDIVAIWSSAADMTRLNKGLEPDAAVAAVARGVRDPRIFTPMEDVGMQGAPITLGDVRGAAEGIISDVQKRREQVQAAGTAATLQAQRNVPIAQSGLRPGHVVWDLEARAPADDLRLTVDEARTNPRYRSVRDKTADQLTSIVEMENLLTEYDPLVGALAKEPGANFGRAFEMWGQTWLGQANPGVAFETMRGTVLRLAGAMQGSRTQLSDQDRKAVENMVPNPLDGLDSGRQKLQILGRILGGMYQAQLGDTRGLAGANAALRQYGGEGGLGRLPAREEGAAPPAGPAAPKAAPLQRREYVNGRWYILQPNGNYKPE